MKQDIHPEYQEVVFLDMSTGKKFLCRSTIKPDETTDFEGKTYPCYKISISSASHPFYTGDQTFVDSEGRVDKFKKRYAKKAQAPAKGAPSEDKKEEVKEEKPKKKAAPKKTS